MIHKKTRFSFRFISLVITGFILFGCGNQSDPTQPGRLVSKPKPKQKSKPVTNVFSDDLNFVGLSLAIDRQLARYNKKDLSGTFSLGKRQFKKQMAYDSLVHFKSIMLKAQNCLLTSVIEEDCLAEFDKKIQNDFIVYRPELEPNDPRFGEADQAFFTAYYTPTLEARSTPNLVYKYPIYKKPQTEKARKQTRKDIDFHGALKGKNLEIAYVKDLFELYLLHVEGGGKVNLIDKGKTESFYISYDGTNGQAWRFISKYMMEKKMIKSPSIAAQRKFLEQNPELQEEIYSTCPSYVYFIKTPTPPLGNDMVPLTDNRSVATDSGLYRFKGLLSFVRSRRLKESAINKTDIDELKDFKSFSRFFIDQDTGGAIKGKARADLFFGEDDYARVAASHMTQRGEIYFLLKK